MFFFHSKYSIAVHDFHLHRVCHSVSVPTAKAAYYMAGVCAPDSLNVYLELPERAVVALCFLLWSLGKVRVGGKDFFIFYFSGFRGWGIPISGSLSLWSAFIMFMLLTKHIWSNEEPYPYDV